MHGAVDFYKEARKRHQTHYWLRGLCRSARGWKKILHRRQGRLNHLVLLAKDQAGYKNLVKLTTSAHLEGYYYKPRIDKQI